MNGFLLVSFSWKLVSWPRSIENMTQNRCGVFIVHGDLRLPNGRTDWFMYVSRTDNLKTLKLRNSYLKLSLFSVEMTDDSTWDGSYYGILLEVKIFNSFLVWFHQAEAKYGEISLNKQQQHSLFPTFPVRGFSWVFYQTIFLHQKFMGILTISDQRSDRVWEFPVSIEKDNSHSWYI